MENAHNAEGLKRLVITQGPTILTFHDLTPLGSIPPWVHLTKHSITASFS